MSTAPSAERGEPSARPAGPPRADVLRVLVVDDEPHARAGIAAMLASRPGYVVAGECGDGRSAVRAIGELAPDLVLLDVQMPEMGGFDVIRAVGPERMPPVVFVTAYDEHALAAFEVQAVDYLLKPFSDRRFAAALDRARSARDAARHGEVGRRLLGLLGRVDGTAAPPAAAPATPRLVVRRADRTILLAPEEVDWIEGASYYARLWAAGRSHLVRETLASLEARLDPARFARVHRSAIVNLERVREVRPTPTGEHAVILRDGTRVPLSRSRWPAFAARLRQWG